MKQYIVFDCYQTLVYKKNLEKIVQNFSLNILKKRIYLSYIKKAYEIMYDRYKFRHPKFQNPKERENFYIDYNKELFKIMGISISSSLSLQLNRSLKNAFWAVYPDVIPTLKYLKRKEIPMGLIANWTEGLNKVLENTKLAPYFNFIHSSHVLNLTKPNPNIFTESLKDISQKFDKIYYVGDDYELDVIPAKEAGLIPILIDRDNKYPDLTDCIHIKKLISIKKLWRL